MVVHMCRNEQLWCEETGYVLPVTRLLAFAADLPS